MNIEKINGYIVVARQYVKREDANCLHCQQPFEYGENVFTSDGVREIAISGVCEKCFDRLSEEYE